MSAPLATPLRTPVRGNVRPLPFHGSDEDLVEGLRTGSPSACAALVDRFSDHVMRVLIRILGRSNEIADLHHDVFVRALVSAKDVRDASSLKGWVTIIAVNVARTVIKRRARSRWLWFLPAEELPEPVDTERDDDAAEGVAALYAVLERMPSDERIAFSLRFIDGMELADVAAACEVSLATIKRRLGRAEVRFGALARRESALAPWLSGSTRFGGSP
ncbi:MAG: sigma-70 family RNA polymerase sigma factor [Polyangiaceae bacterium]